jgi:tagaturonate reductase
VTRIIQFGTSRFLQAHVDLFVHQARVAGADVGPITVVKTTPGDDRAGRIAALKRARAYPVRIRGIAAGAVIDETISVTSIDQAFDAHREWPDVVESFAREADIAVSNTSDAGTACVPEDAGHDFASPVAPAGFPAKLLALLLARFRAGGRPMLYLPTELLSGNGHRLAATVARLASETGQSDEFRDWLANQVTFADTLVDRIVSAPIEPVGAVAEPYALWAIKRGNFPNPIPRPEVQLVDEIAPFERLKLHILISGTRCSPTAGCAMAATRRRPCVGSWKMPPSPTISMPSMITRCFRGLPCAA